ncbi:MAG: hypothetical protein WC587_01725 [Candidatus Paceibacterota bacterium]
MIFHNATIFDGTKNISQEKSGKAEVTDYFKDINLEAKAAYVFDVAKNKPIFELNADTRLPLASLTKIMTAVVALENIPQEQKTADLLSIMLVSSSNDAAVALSLGVELPSGLGSSTPFVSLMNKKAEEIGMAQTSFFNPTGLDVSFESAGAYGSARDAAKLMEYFVKNYPKVAEATRYESLNVGSKNFKNTDKLAEFLPGIIAGKTGTTDLAGGNLVVAIDIGLGHPVIIAVLGSTEEGRFEDVKKLYEATVKSLTSE